MDNKYLTPQGITMDLLDRNVVEGAFGTFKTAHGLGRLVARLECKSHCVIGGDLLLFNLMKRLRDYW